jgi:hypothetical protein
MTNLGAYPADFQAPKSLDGWGTQHLCSIKSIVGQEKTKSQHIKGAICAGLGRI